MQKTTFKNIDHETEEIKMQKRFTTSLEKQHNYFKSTFLY